MARFKIDKYGVLEINRAEYLKTGMIVSQTPLGADFAEENSCENGMWVDANKANGEIKKVSSNTKVYGIVYTAEKDFTGWRPALKYFAQKKGDYPRIGILNVGDTFTTNTFSYAFSKSTANEQFAELKEAFKGSKLYVIPTVGEGAPTVTTELPVSGPYAEVTKLYTVPDGTPGIKYVMVRV